MKRMFIVALALISFSSLAEVKQVYVLSGDKLKINVMDCSSNEQASLKINEKSGLVFASCAKAACQAVSKSGKYNVYRFQENECEWNGCNEKAKLVGSFKADVRFGAFSKNALKKAMTSYLKTSNECGKIRVFVHAYTGFLEVE